MKETLSQEYLLLFNTLSDAEERLMQLYTSLVAAQQRAEELYLEKH